MRRVAGKPAARLRRDVQAYFLAALVSFMLACGAGSASAAPITVTDIVGRSVSLEAPAKRIVLGAGRSIVVLGLIHPDPVSTIIGWRNDFTRDTATYDAWKSAFPSIDQIPQIGVPGDVLSAEAVIDLKPDLVVLSLYDAQSAGMNRVIGILDSVGIPVLVVDFFTEPLENALPSLRLLGQVLGASDKAEAFVTFYESKLALVRDRIASQSIDRPRVFMHALAGGMICCATPGHGTFNAMIDLAGGQNIALDQVPGPYGDVSLEQLLVDDPDFYLPTGGAFLAARGGLVLGTGIDARSATDSFKTLLATPGLADLTAIREGRAHALWHNFNDSPVNIVLIEKLAKIFHPDLFRDVDPQSTIDEINREFSAVPMIGTYWVDP